MVTAIKCPACGTGVIQIRTTEDPGAPAGKCLQCNQVYGTQEELLEIARKADIQFPKKKKADPEIRLPGDIQLRFHDQPLLVTGVLAAGTTEVVLPLDWRPYQPCESSIDRVDALFDVEAFNLLDAVDRGCIDLQVDEWKMKIHVFTMKSALLEGPSEKLPPGVNDMISSNQRDEFVRGLARRRVYRIEEKARMKIDSAMTVVLTFRVPEPLLRDIPVRFAIGPLLAVPTL